MTEPLTVSVALATYNGAPFLREQLDSLAGQQRQPIELIVTDDGSSDGTEAIVADFARQASFPVFFSRNEPRLGFRGNFMRAAELCSGSLIAFCDQDDVWLPNKLAVQIADFNDPAVLASSHNASLIDAEGRDLGRQLRQFPRSGLLSFRDTSPFLFSRGFTQVVRRDLLRFGQYLAMSKDIGDLAEPMSHDQWFFFLALIIGRVRYHDTVLSLYRQHGNNWSGAVETPRRKLARRLSDRRAEYARLPVVWKNRADLLTAILADPESETLTSLASRREMEVARTFYLRLHAASHRRHAIYEAGSIPAKILRLANALANGDYRPNSVWHFGLWGALRDLTMKS